MAAAKKIGKRTPGRWSFGGRFRTMAEGGPLRFAREALAELRRSRWPTREETIRLTAVVVAVSLLLAAFLGMFDFGLARLGDLLFR